MIVGTAGHVDHGKTSLVRALSGVDTDRLKEEKARGISIELGYAYVPLANGEVLGIIDVPGHEKFVHTMAAGASGIDFALLVVAADDGVMPQTREHLSIVQWLGIVRGAVAITKTDRVDAARVRAVRAEVAALLAGTALAEAPMFDTCAMHADDAGVAALSAHLRQAAASLAMRRDDGLFRLAVDRVFTLAGQGTIVTGTVVSGHVEVDQTLTIAPQGQPVRVRSIHAQNRPATRGRAGERCALNLAGIEKSALTRGDWIVDARIGDASMRLDAMLSLAADATTPLKHWAPLHVHLGTQHQVAHVALLDGATLAPGGKARVQLVFGRPVCALPGDRLIVRNAQATQTIGGGYVLDPFAPERKRRTPERLAWLDALDTMIADGALAPLLAHAPDGLPVAMLERLTGQPGDRLHVPSRTRVIETGGGEAVWMSDAAWHRHTERLRDVLARYHERSPDEPGIDSARLRRMCAPSLDENVWRAIVDDCCADGRLARDAQWLRLPDHTVTLADDERALADALLPAIRAGRFDPPWVRDLATTLAVDEARVRALLRKLARMGAVYQVVRDLFYDARAVQELASIVATQASNEPQGVAAAGFRDATGLGRKRAIQVLEFFDRVGYTRFSRDAHVVRPDSHWLDTQASPRID